MRASSILGITMTCLAMPSMAEDPEWPRAWFEARKTASELALPGFPKPDVPLRPLDRQQLGLS